MKIFFAQNDDGNSAYIEADSENTALPLAVAKIGQKSAVVILNECPPYGEVVGHLESVMSILYEFPCSDYPELEAAEKMLAKMHGEEYEEQEEEIEE